MDHSEDGPMSLAAELLYRHRLKQTEAFDIYFDVPAVIYPHITPAYQPPDWPASSTFLFIVPGISIQSPGRLSLILGSGAGVATLREGPRLISGAENLNRYHRTRFVGQFHVGFELQATSDASIAVTVPLAWPQGRRFIARPNPQNLSVFRGATTVGILLHF